MRWAMVRRGPSLGNGGDLVRGPGEVCGQPRESIIWPKRDTRNISAGAAPESVSRTGDCGTSPHTTRLSAQPRQPSPSELIFDDKQ